MLIDLQRARGKRIAFRNGTGTEADQLVLCTGYSIDLPFLPEEVANKTINRTTNAIQVWQGKGKGLVSGGKNTWIEVVGTRPG